MGLIYQGRVPSASVGSGSEDRDVAVGGATGKAEAELVGCPGDGIHGGFVFGEDVGLGPLVGISGVFFPDDDAAVVGAGGEDGSELGVGPGDLPDRTLMAGKGGEVLLGSGGDAEDLDGGVRGGSGHSLAVVVHGHVVDYVLMTCLDLLRRHVSLFRFRSRILDLLLLLP